jgi:hypothetical protein
MIEIIKTDDGYMVQHMDGELEGQYLWDMAGNNLFDTYEEAERVFYGLDKPIALNIPDWDWGEKSNKKLRKMFSIPADQPMHKDHRLEFFLNYLLQEVDINELVSEYLYHAPMKVLISQADAIGSFELEEDEE